MPRLQYLVPLVLVAIQLSRRLVEGRFGRVLPEFFSPAVFAKNGSINYI